MKNIHLLPTDKPSRLFYNKKDSIFTIDNDFENVIEEDWFQDYNIYITSDEEIKEEDWYYLPRTNSVHKCIEDPTELNSERRLGVAKIILTTDQDLIGVQSIDDDFLEWFVKNPSCEEIEVKHFGTCCGNQLIAQCINCKQYNPVYKIIIPKEEPKQEKITAVEWLVNQIAENLGIRLKNSSIGVSLLNQAKEMEIKQREELYNETEVLQLLIKLKQTESFDNLYDWFNQNKKNNL